MSKRLLDEIKITRVSNAAAAGTSDVNGTGVDMQGFDGVLFVAAVGTLTATQVTTLKAQSSTDDGSTDAYADISGAVTAALADGDSNKLLVLDVHHPSERYVRPVLDRGTANAVLDGIIAIQYRAGSRPTSNGSTVSSAVGYSGQ